ncbi:hypothetical protein DXA30_02840 [Fusobacterium ulcerans]|uniref:hypothetical protein n=1 Tax=Fusobacterium ulcerans TaxID=861 RepID=UPI000E489521|nr:hypothetical protein [Fusobacterium ulcerans]RGY66707.1 hypothetical protein DXA30_02840 [Fusobacterium ulcerans]
MKCNYCGEEICQDENFYIVRDQICCKKCCEENTHTYYTVCDETYEEDEVTPFENKEEAIASYEEDIITLERRIAETERSDAPWKDDYIKRHREEIEETQDLLKALEDKD